jgi:hypothetical protein
METEVRKGQRKGRKVVRDESVKEIFRVISAGCKQRLLSLIRLSVRWQIRPGFDNTLYLEFLLGLNVMDRIKFWYIFGTLLEGLTAVLDWLDFKKKSDKSHTH